MTQAAERAVRAAVEHEPWLPMDFVWWAVSRAVAMALLVGAGWLVYYCGSSDHFRVRSVRVQGNVLLNQDEVTSTAAVAGANIFWIDRAQVAARLNALPLVQRVDIGATLPDTIDIRIVERQPVAFWTSGDQSYLVDAEGVILKAVDADTAQARACAGQPCDPRLAALTSVAQMEGQALAPGDRVNAGALVLSARLAALLPGIGVQPVSFDWSAESGLEVPTRDGWRARFDETGNIEQQVATLRAARDELTRSKSAAQLVDVRFGDRPYFR
jgi:cell division protein FtsQ